MKSREFNLFFSEGKKFDFTLIELLKARQALYREACRR